MRLLFLFLLAISIHSQYCTAQDMTGMEMAHPSKNIYLAMMDTMMSDMSKPQTTTTIGDYFLSQMIPHHEGALTMANYEIAHGKNFKMKQIAKSILAEQENEIQLMRIWLKSSMADTGINEEYKKEMAQTMYKMMADLPNELSPNDTDRSFALVMIPHHQAGIDMARVLLKYDTQNVLRAYATQLISSQTSDIEQMKDLLKNNL